MNTPDDGIPGHAVHRWRRSSTTWRFHLAIASSLRLRFDNQDLIESLQTAKNETDALNRDLELRVRDRTAELSKPINARTNSSRRWRTSSGIRSHRSGSRWRL